MIVDASAVLSILLGEDDAPLYAEAISQAGPCRMSAINWLEATMVADRQKDPIISLRLDQMMADTGIRIVPVTVEQAQAARQAWRVFGKGRHPARLNLADCFAYALARTEGEPLLFKGGDFSQTDIQPALKG